MAVTPQNPVQAQGNVEKSSQMLSVAGLLCFFFTFQWSRDVTCPSEECFHPILHALNVEQTGYGNTATTAHMPTRELIDSLIAMCRLSHIAGRDIP